MKCRYRSCAVVLGALLLGCIFLAGRVESAGAGKGPVVRWEYAYVLHSKTQLGSAFNSPGQSVRADTAFNLYQQLGGRRSNSEFTLADLTSDLGAQGWELVSFETQDNVATTYWFKRPAP